MLGLTFKENVPDLRNSKVVDLISALRSKGHAVDIHDTLADRAEARASYDLELLDRLDTCGRFDCIIGAVPHAPYVRLSAAELSGLLENGGLLADLKGMWRGLDLGGDYRRWEL